MSKAKHIRFYRYSAEIAGLSLGLAGIIDYGNLDLGEGSGTRYGYGIQLGAIYQPIESISVGLNYISPRKISHDNVADFDGNGSLLEERSFEFGLVWRF